MTNKTPGQIEEARLNVLNVFAKHYEGSKPFNLSDFLSDLSERREDLVTLNEYHSDENDTRSGKETYGYEDIEETLNYISDRWACQFRIKWLIDLVDRA